MSTGERPTRRRGPPGHAGGPGPFTEEEIARSPGRRPTPSWRTSSAAEIDEDSRSEISSPSRSSSSKSRRLSAGAGAHRARERCSSCRQAASRWTSCYEATGIERRAARGGARAARRHAPRRASAASSSRGGGRLAVPHRPRRGEYVRRFLRVKPQRLTRAAVETLAIIAYRQPVTRPGDRGHPRRGLRRGGQGAARAPADQDPREEGGGRAARSSTAPPASSSSSSRSRTCRRCPRCASSTS